VEVADRSVVPADELVGAEELAVVEISDEVASCPDAISGQTLTASPSIEITKTLRAFKFLFWELRSRQKTKNLNH
jgi:hypothetical protein